MGGDKWAAANARRVEAAQLRSWYEGLKGASQVCELEEVREPFQDDNAHPKLKYIPVSWKCPNCLHVRLELAEWTLTGTCVSCAQTQPGPTIPYPSQPPVDVDVRFELPYPQSLLRVRERAGMRAQDAAGALGWSIAMYSRIETRYRDLSEWQLLELTMVFPELHEDMFVISRIRNVVCGPALQYARQTFRVSKSSFAAHCGWKEHRQALLEDRKLPAVVADTEADAILSTLASLSHRGITG